MNRRGAEAQSENEITEIIIGRAIEVHRVLGPGLLESAYEACLIQELIAAGVDVQSQVSLPVIYKGTQINVGYVIDLVVGDRVIVELKAVEKLLPVHEAQLLTYLKLRGCSVGLLINFHVPVLRQGIRRLVNKFQESSAPQRLCG